MGEYTPFHRSIVMAMMGRGIMDKEEFIENFENMKDHYHETPNVDTAELEPTIKTINEEIARYDFEISLTKYDYSGDEFYVFISKVPAPENRFQNLYTEVEIQYFPLLIRDIITSDNSCISPIDALNLSSKLPKPLSMTRAEEVLEEWTNVGYFRKIDDMVYLGPRMLVEFNGYMRVHFLDYLHTCFMCKNTVYKPLTCLASSCDVALHESCIARYQENFPNACPSCKGKWK